jgi:hypothetical protein
MTVSFMFGLMLIPMIIDSINGYTVNIISAFLITIGLYVIACCFFTLKLKLSFLSEIFAGTAWLILFVFSLLKVIT